MAIRDEVTTHVNHKCLSAGVSRVNISILCDLLSERQENRRVARPSPASSTPAAVRERGFAVTGALEVRLTCLLAFALRLHVSLAR